MSTIPPLRPEPKRDSYGRYVLPDPTDGQPTAWTRASTVVDALKDKSGLIDWKARKAAVGAVASPEVAARLASLDAEIELNKDDWRTVKPLKQDAKYELEALLEASGANAGRNKGTEAHTLSEWADVGRIDEVIGNATEGQKADLVAYLAAMDGAGIERPAQYVEQIVINLTVNSAGTFDRLVRLRDGRLVVADLKSQQSVDFGFLEICCQLAQYANADFMVIDGALQPMPAELDKTVGIVMHAPVGKGTCDLYEVDLVAGWEAALVAHQIRQLRSASKKLGRLYKPPATEPSDPLLYLIRSAPNIQSLEGLWIKRTPGQEWRPHHIVAAGQRRRELTPSS